MSEWIQIKLDTRMPTDRPFLLCHVDEFGAYSIYEGFSAFDFYDIDPQERGDRHYYCEMPEFLRMDNPIRVLRGAPVITCDEVAEALFRISQLTNR